MALNITFDGDERQDFQLSAFLFSLSRKMVLNLETLNKYLEEEIDS